MRGGDWYWQAAGLLDTIYAYDRGDAPDPARYSDLVVIRGRWADGVLMGHVQDATQEANPP